MDFDLLVIGAGSGGVRAARMAAAKGIKVGIIEEKYLGGTCVNVGCVPKKLLVYAAQFNQHFHEAAAYGWQVGKTCHHWPSLIANKDKEIARLNGIYQRLLENAGVQIIWGRAQIVDGQHVSVAGKTFSANKILICVGAKPAPASFVGAEHCFNSDQAFYLPEIPKSLVIVGGGYIALEFAGIFSGLGCQVHVLARSQILRQFDQTVASFVKQEIEKKGIVIHQETEILALEKTAEGLRCQLNHGQDLLVERVMYAAGRVPVTDNLGLENTQVQLYQAKICVDEHFQTAEPSIYALGDVIGTPELTPVALAQAMVFVDQQFGENQKKMSYEAIASAVFCQPNIAFVGITEQEAVQKNIACDVYVSEFTALKQTLSGTGERSLVKLIVEQSSQCILGVHIVGEDVGEIMQGFAVAVKNRLTKAQLDATIGIHPTFAEELVTLREKKYSI